MYKVENSLYSKAAFGIFKKKSEIRNARGYLNSAGISNAEISIMYPPHPGPQDFSQRQGSEVKWGAIFGAMIGGVLLSIAGIILNLRMSTIDLSTQSTNTPHFYQLFVYGFAGLFCGAILGAACGALAGIGIPETAGNRYGDYVDAGGILMSVHVDNANQAQVAQKGLELAGAQDINLLEEKAGWDMVFTKLVEHQQPRNNLIDIEN